MEKRLILAIALALLILFSWSAWVSKFYPVDNKRVITKTLPSPVSLSTPETAPLKSDLPVSENVENVFLFPQDKFDLVFLETKAALAEAVYKDYHSYSFPLQYGFFLGEGLVFKKESSREQAMTFVHIDDNKKIIKHFIFHNSSYTIELELQIQNLSNQPSSFNLPLVLGVLDFSKDQALGRFQDVTAGLKDKTLHFNARREMSFEGVNFLGLRERYFCVIIEPQTVNCNGFIKKINPHQSEVGLILPEIRLNPGENTRQQFRIYLGPQELKLLSAVKPEWTAVMYFGIFDFIARILLQFLGGLYAFVKNWGLAIILLSLLIYIILFPLSLRQMRSMKEMQALQPKIEELRKAYKDQPQKLNQEIMKLYRQHKVNPFGGCLPLILQIPIFFSLYQVLMRSVALKGAPFLWIKDLSQPDRLFILPVSLPIIGNEINILPILMAIGMFIQQKISTKMTGATAKEQQRLMLVLFPLMFGFIFYRMPAGLVLYWFVNTVLMTLYQFRINRAR